jgi:FtsP/CotA-like multicopper oxidase with cupredoxin domain
MGIVPHPGRSYEPAWPERPMEYRMQGIATVLTRRRLLAGVATTLVWLPARAQEQTRPTVAEDGFRLLRAGVANLPAKGQNRAPIAMCGYDGVSPGPVLRVKRGEQVRVRLINGLPWETSLHWHGVRVPNAMDGVPHLTQAPVAPHASFDYRFTAPDAGTFWYHAHGPGQLERGLVGALIVEEPEPVAVDREVLLVLADPRSGSVDSTAEGSPPPLPGHGQADREPPTVNGQASLDIAVKANERIRLRLVNASHVRPMSLRLDPHRATVVAIDGQPAEPFVARDHRVGLAPGNRLDLFIEMTLEPGAEAPLHLATAQGEIAIARFRYEAGAPMRAAPLPDPKPLPANPLPQRIPLQNAHRLDVAIDRGTRPWIPAKAAASGQFGPPLFTVKRGRTVMLGFANRGDPAVLHLHGHHVRLLDNLDDGWKPFWLDTLMVVQQIARIAFVADNPGKWLIEARAVQGDDAGMATWFEVT